MVEGILLAASLPILPKPLQLEGAAYRPAGEGGCTSKGGKSPGQHGAKADAHICAFTCIPIHCGTNSEIGLGESRSVVGGGGVKVELSGVTGEWVWWRGDAAAEGKTAQQPLQRTRPLHSCPLLCRACAAPRRSGKQRIQLASAVENIHF